MTSAMAIADGAQPRPKRPIGFMTSVSQSVRTSAIARSTLASTRSVAPASRGGVVDHDDPRHGRDEDDQPSRPGPAQAARQRRGRARGPSAAPQASDRRGDLDGGVVRRRDVDRELGRHDTGSLLEPAGRDGRRWFADRNLGVEAAQSIRSSRRADTLSSDRTRSGPKRSTSSVRTSGTTFSAGWSPRSSSSSTRSSLAMNGSVREQQRDVDVALIERLPGDRTSGVELDELLELGPVDPPDAREALGARRTLGRSAERQMRSDAGEIAQRAEAFTSCGLTSHDERVRVLCRRGSQRSEARTDQRAHEALVGGPFVRDPGCRPESCGT